MVLEPEKVQIPFKKEGDYITTLYPEKDSLYIAYSEDNRSTGWGRDGEWFDTENSICFGLLQYKSTVEFAKEIQFEKY